MASGASSLPLAALEVLVVDCQATAAAPRGHLLEIGWGRLATTLTSSATCLIALPGGERVPPAVARITGITDRMMQAGVDERVAWRSLAAQAALLATQPAPTVIHFARFEQPFLDRLAGGAPSFDVVCTHAVAARLFPDLPRRSLRALAGYFGRSVGPLRRSADHVAATAFVWRQLVTMLERDGIATWSDLKQWLAAPVTCSARRKRVWPMPRDLRLALPDAPGIYRMLRTNGDVLYVGKAASLRVRVNSYFRHQRGVPERMLEMLSQARGISFQETATALDAALLEPDEIKRHRPPYNIALTDAGPEDQRGGATGRRADRRVWFASRDLLEHAPRRSPRCPIGPFPSGETLEQFAALARDSGTALGTGRWAPDQATFGEGCARFRRAHVEMSHNRLSTAARLLRVGTRLWREGRRDRDGDDEAFALNDRGVAAWTPEYVQLCLEWLAIRAALARRRATWFTRLAEASVLWREPDSSHSCLIVIDNGDIALRTTATAGASIPIPPGYRRPAAARREAFTLARFDRLRVLTTEFKRLVAAGAPVAVRFGVSSPLDGARFAALLGWL